MTRKKWPWFIVGGVAGFVLVQLFQNCGITKPQVEDSSVLASSFPHTGVEVSCSVCHEPSRPTADVRLPLNFQVAINESPSQFVHKEEFGGRGDCVSCHTEDRAFSGVTWSGGYFDHTMAAGGKVTACADCHKVPTANPTTTPAIAFNHSLVTTDCAGCHSKAGISWAQAKTHPHAATDVCLTCHTGDRPAATTLKPDKVTGTPYKNLFVHTSQFVLGKDCNACHIKNLANLGTSWKGGYFDHKDASGANVSSCLTCHTSGEDRPADNTRLPASATNATNVYYHHASFGGAGDCVRCHAAAPANLGVTWAGAVYDHRDGNNAPISGNCVACHLNQMPAAATALPADLRNSFVHDAKYVGAGDCVGCHTPKQTATATQSAWSGAAWSGRGANTHKDTTGATVTTCLPCHSNRDHNRGQECFGCHRNAGRNWGRN